MRIAVLDQESDQRQLINEAIGGLGHECHSYSEGGQLLQILRRQTFDLIILERCLPDICGLEVVRIARTELKSRVPVLVVTSRCGEADVV